MSDSADTRILAIREHCFAQDSDRITEEYPWGHPVWKVAGKLFAAGPEDGSEVTVKATPDQQTVLIQHPAIRVADYVGRYGWVTVEVTDDESLELARDLIDESFEMVRPKSRGAKSAARG